jgi:hypothetical protein
MRFGQDGGWYKKDAPFAFNFILQDDTKNRNTLAHKRFRSANKEGILKLIERLEGIDQTKNLLSH